jgi:hypothetical protein
MPTPIWPSTLQQRVNKDTFSYKKGSTVIKSDVDIGPSKIRRRFTRAVDLISCSIWLTIPQYTIFENFYNIEVAGGATSFFFNHPITGVQLLVRFTTEPDYRPVGGVDFAVAFTLEVIG